MNVLLEAQFPSGGWPTVYPRYKDRDLHDDFYAKSTWTAILALLRAVLGREYPFDTDIADAIEPAALETALQRIPPQEKTKRFMYSDYAGEALNGGHLTKRYKSAITCSHGRYPKADGDG